MKTLCLSLGFALVLGVAHVPAQSAPAIAPAASPVPAVEPEPASTASGCCPMCKMDGEAKNVVKTEVAFKQGGEKPADDAEQAVVDLEKKWCEAEARHDVAFLEKVEADGFTFTDSTGKVTTKQDEITEAKQGGETVNFKLSDMKAHLYGSAAILTGTDHVSSCRHRPTRAGRLSLDRRFRAPGQRRMASGGESSDRAWPNEKLGRQAKRVERTKLLVQSCQLHFQLLFVRGCMQYL